jgi:uncharacterized protein YdiU (UPF0061 family)
MNILQIRLKKITAGKTQIINRVQQIGFAHTVIPVNTDNGMVKGKTFLLVIFILGNGDVSE